MKPSGMGNTPAKDEKDEKDAKDKKSITRPGVFPVLFVFCVFLGPGRWAANAVSVAAERG
jgi:hypothetical protein